MERKRYIVMGAGAVGTYLAETLAGDGHSVTLIDSNDARQGEVEDRLDVGFVHGNGSHLPTLRRAGVEGCDLFVAASSSDEANLVAAHLAKREGARRTAVRVSTTEEITEFGRSYEEAFSVDLMLSTQLLATTRIVNHVLGYNTHEIEYLANGQLQVRKTQVTEHSLLRKHALADLTLPPSCLVLAFVNADRLRVPTGADRAEPGDAALLFADAVHIDEFEEKISGRVSHLGTVVIGGGGATAREVAKRLAPVVRRIKIIERSRARCEELAAEHPDYEILHGDVTDAAVLTAENVGGADHFIALTGNDETNLMACLLAQEQGAKGIAALVQQSDTSTLWRRVGLIHVVSPRITAATQISDYIKNGYQRSIMSVENGTAQFVHRRVEAESPAAGVTLAEAGLPFGLIVAAVLRGERSVVPQGDTRLEVGDEVILFVHRDELAMTQLVFPGPDRI